MRAPSATFVANLGSGLLLIAAILAATALPSRADAPSPNFTSANPRDPLRADDCTKSFDGANCVVVLVDHLRRMRFDEPVRR